MTLLADVLPPREVLTLSCALTEQQQRDYDGAAEAAEGLLCPARNHEEDEDTHRHSDDSDDNRPGHCWD